MTKLREEAAAVDKEIRRLKLFFSERRDKQERRRERIQFGATKDNRKDDNR
jgi:hypothetical protein